MSLLTLDLNPGRPANPARRAEGAREATPRLRTPAGRDVRSAGPARDEPPVPGLMAAYLTVFKLFS